MHGKNIEIFATGLKGEVFVSRLLGTGLRPNIIVSYAQENDLANSFSKLSVIAERENIEFRNEKYPQSSMNSLVFIVGWQYLLKELNNFSVVFHDSLLPRYRGFAPTVTALINGEPEIGVSALIPSEAADEGPILCQASTSIKYPIKIVQALELQAGLMVDLAVQIHKLWEQEGCLKAQNQDDQAASYSLWRDELDYRIDWSQSADEIRRFIDAVGYPYNGARTKVGGDEVTIENASVVSELYFERRDIGKVWRIEDGRPVIVCGSGLLQINCARKLNGEQYEFKKVRVRMG